MTNEQKYWAVTIILIIVMWCFSVSVQKTHTAVPEVQTPAQSTPVEHEPLSNYLLVPKSYK